MLEIKLHETLIILQKLERAIKGEIVIIIYLI